MNSTSFTSIDSACAANNDKMANIDSSSTAHLTLNAVNRPLTTPSTTIKSTRVRNNSDLSNSDPDRSPSVTVITSSINNNNNLHHLHHNHHHHHSHLHNSLARPAQLITGGFSLSNRLHLTKHQRTLWSRATSLEKLLMLAVILLSTTTILLFVSLVSVFMSQTKQQLNEQSNNSAHIEIMADQNSNQNKSYCLTPDCVKVAASVIEAIDLTVDPCDDFYVSPISDKHFVCFQINQQTKLF